MGNFEMNNTDGCWVAVMNTVVCHLDIGSFITQFNITQPARLGKGRPAYTFKGRTNRGAQISGEVLSYVRADDLRVKVYKAKLKLVWSHDWRPEGKNNYGQFECQYLFPDHGFAGGYDIIRI